MASPYNAMLLSAAANGSPSNLHIALAAGANLHAVSVDGLTAVHLAAGSRTPGTMETLNELLDRGASLSGVSVAGLPWTPLHAAVRDGKIEAVRLLLDKGAAVDGVLERGYTPLHSAAVNGRDKVMHLLLERGARVDIVDAKGHTPLHSVADASHDHSGVVGILLNAGVSLHAKSEAGKTALDLARERGNRGIAKMLEDAAAKEERDRNVAAEAAALRSEVDDLAASRARAEAAALAAKSSAEETARARERAQLEAEARCRRAEEAQRSLEAELREARKQVTETSAARAAAEAQLAEQKRKAQEDAARAATVLRAAQQEASDAKRATSEAAAARSAVEAQLTEQKRKAQEEAARAATALRAAQQEVADAKRVASEAVAARGAAEAQLAELKRKAQDEAARAATALRAAQQEVTDAKRATTEATAARGATEAQLTEIKRRAQEEAARAAAALRAAQQEAADARRAAAEAAAALHETETQLAEQQKRSAQEVKDRESELAKLKETMASLESSSAAAGGAAAAAADSHTTLGTIEMTSIVYERDGTENVTFGNGKVLGAKWLGEPVAVKKITIPADIVTSGKFWRGVQLQMQMNHRNVLRVYGASLKASRCEASYDCTLVLERMAVNLSEALHGAFIANSPSARIQASLRGNLPVQLRILLDVAHGLSYLHARNVVHGDLKTANILLNNDGVAHIAKFTSAVKRLRDEGATKHQPSLLGMRGTLLAYMDPAITAEGVSIKPSSDVYSWSVVAWEVLTGKQPYSGMLTSKPAMSDQELLRAIVRGARPADTLDALGVSADLRNLIQDCWNFDRTARPTVGSIVETLEKELRMMVSSGAVSPTSPRFHAF